VIVGVDVAKLAFSPIVERAIDQLLLRDPVLQQSWQEVHDGCKIDVIKQVKHVVLAIGPHAPGGRPGTGPTLLIATGTLPEHDPPSASRRSSARAAARSPARRSVDARSIRSRTARTRCPRVRPPDTVIMGSSDAYVTDALGTGPKATANPDMAGWLKLVDMNAPIWGVGRVDEQ